MNSYLVPRRSSFGVAKLRNSPGYYLHLAPEICTFCITIYFVQD